MEATGPLTPGFWRVLTMAVAVALFVVWPPWRRR
jgi:hypothetical protein